MSTTVYVEKPVVVVENEAFSLMSKLSVKILESEFKLNDLKESINDEMTLGHYKKTMNDIHQIEKELKLCYDLHEKLTAT